MLEPQIIDKPEFTVVDCEREFIHSLSPEAKILTGIGSRWSGFVGQIMGGTERTAEDVVICEVAGRAAATHASRWIGSIVAVCLIAACGPTTSKPPSDLKAGALQIAGEAFFVDRADELGIEFQHETDPPGSYFLPEIMGSGCALFDFDRDGDLDVLLVNLGSGYTHGAVMRQVRHRLYEQTERGRFVDVSDRAGLVSNGLGMGVAVGDANNDGWPDVYFTSYGPDQLFLNQGDGRFSDVTAAAGIENLHWGSSACFIDFDRDGWLDLFVANYVDYGDRACTRVGGGGRDYCGPHLFPGTAARLFRNVTGDLVASPSTRPVGAVPNESVRFQDVSLESGIASKRGPGLGVAAADFNGDGWPDLYVANDQAANFLWINQHNGTFLDEAVVRGCAYDAQGNAQASMGVALGDPDHDSDLDLFLTHLDGERNTLYLRQPSGSFEDASNTAGLGLSSVPFTGFGTAFADLDLDGDEDLVVVNGRVKRPELASSATVKQRSIPGSTVELPALTVGDFWSSYRQRGQIWLNDGEAKFQEWLGEKDGLLSSKQLSRGLAVGDIDNDGDLDFVVNRIGARAAIYMNEAPRRGHWLAIKVVDPQRGGRDVYGATVTVVANGHRWIRCLQPGLSYLSSHAPTLHVGLGSVDHIERLEVKWPEGTQTDYPANKVDREYVLERKAD